MSRFSLTFNNNYNNNFNNNFNNNLQPKSNSHFNKNMTYYICSSGGCGSTILFNYLSNFGNVHHIHDRYPPNKLQYVGSKTTSEDINIEWFNGVEIPENEVENYKVIFIYRHPIPVIFSRFAQKYGPNTKHLQNIKCDNSGNINFFDVLRERKDLYKMEEFFDNYTTIVSDRNYDIYCIKYELFFNHIRFFNKIMNIPDINELYPIKYEKTRKYQYINELKFIYKKLIKKMEKMTFITRIPKIQNGEFTIEKENSL